METDEQSVALNAALTRMHKCSLQLQRSIDTDDLMDALKQCSALIAEFRTGALGPKKYYELYMKGFDALAQLAEFIRSSALSAAGNTNTRNSSNDGSDEGGKNLNNDRKDAGNDDNSTVSIDHKTGEDSLSRTEHVDSEQTESVPADLQYLEDLYKLVQYAGNVIPRLYLLFTVGSVYLSFKGAPIVEILRDTMEMARGVQHPIRGLFLREYLGSQIKDFLAVGYIDLSDEKLLSEYVDFVLQNFREANKLWVRYQYLGPSCEAERRNQERRELRTLVGMNLVRLSDIDAINVDMYRSKILPAIIEQIVQCRDVLAQEYLMEVIVQTFPDEFQLQTIGDFLEAVNQLTPRTPIRPILSALIDRIASLAEHQSKTDGDVKSFVENVRNGVAALSIAAEKSAINSDDSPKNSDIPQKGVGDSQKDVASAEEGSGDAGLESTSSSLQLQEVTSTAANTSEAGKSDATFDSEAASFKLIDLFWQRIQSVIKARDELSIADIIGLLSSLLKLTLSYTPDNVDQIECIFRFANECAQCSKKSADFHSQKAQDVFLDLLTQPLAASRDIKKVMSIASFIPLLHSLDRLARKSEANIVIDKITENNIKIGTLDETKWILELIDVFVEDDSEQQQEEQQQIPPKAHVARYYSYEHGRVARLLHYFESSDVDVFLKILRLCEAKFAAGARCFRATAPTLVYKALSLTQKLGTSGNETKPQSVSHFFRFVDEVSTKLAFEPDNASLALRLFLSAATIADQCGLEEIEYEFFSRFFQVYEESISRSNLQYVALNIAVQTLYNSRNLQIETYDSLCTKLTLLGSKLLKRSDQVRMICATSHLRWQEPADGEKDAGNLYGDEQKTLECLQKALKIADSCLDRSTSLELMVEILNQYIYFFARKVDVIQAKFIRSIIGMIQEEFDNLSEHNQQKPVASLNRPLEKHLNQTVNEFFMQTLKMVEQNKLVDERWRECLPQA